MSMCLVRDLTVDLPSTKEGARRQVQKVPRYFEGYTVGSPFLVVCLFYEWIGAMSYKTDHRWKRLAEEALEKARSSH